MCVSVANTLYIGSGAETVTTGVIEYPFPGCTISKSLIFPLLSTSALNAAIASGGTIHTVGGDV